KWKLVLKDKAQEAETHLSSVTDPRSVPMLGRVFCDDVADHQSWAVRVLSAIDAPNSTQLLARLAVFSAYDQIRESSIDLLRRRPARDYGETLVEMIHTPATYRIQPVQGPGSKGILLVDTPRFQLTRSYDAPAAFRLGSNFFGYVGYDGNGLPVAARGREVE